MRAVVPDFYLGALGGALATVIAFLAYVYGPINGADFAFVVAGGIVALLPSRTLTSATEDLLSGFPVTGTARLFAVMFHTLGLIIGVASGLGISLQLAVALELGFEPPGIDKLAWASAPVPIVIGGAVFIGFAGALTLIFVSNRQLSLVRGIAAGSAFISLMASLRTLAVAHRATAWSKRTLHEGVRR